MKSNKSSLTGPGKFQWNMVSWLASMFGSSAWMLVTSCFLVAHNHPWIASVAAGGFLVIMIASIVLWAYRDRVYPFAALIAMMGLMAFAFPLVWLVVQTYASDEARHAMNWPISRWSTIFVFLLAPVSMVWCIYLERFAKLNNQSRANNHKTFA